MALNVMFYFFETQYVSETPKFKTKV